MQETATPKPSTLTQTVNVVQSFRVLFGGLIGGPLLVLGGIWLLIFTEQMGASDALSLDEGQRQVVAAAAERLDPQLEGKLIHVSSVTTIAAPVKDEQFDITADGVKLERIVEMCQWVEEKNLGDDRRDQPYVYRTSWRGELIDSTKFRQVEGHHNPNYFPFEYALHRNPQLKFGAYQLNGSQVDRIPSTEQREITEDELLAISDLIKVPGGELIGGDLYLDASEWVPTVPFMNLNPAYEPLPGKQQIGNLRIRFRYARPGELTVVAKQAGPSFLPYNTSAGEVDLVRVGLHEVNGMFDQARSEQWPVIWGFRALSLICVALGCCGVTLALGSLAWLMGITEEFPVFRLGCIGTIILITIVVVLAWHRIDSVFTSVVIVLAAFSLAAIGWSFRSVRPAEEEIVAAEFADKGFRSKYPTFLKRE